MSGINRLMLKHLMLYEKSWSWSWKKIMSWSWF